MGKSKIFLLAATAVSIVIAHSTISPTWSQYLARTTNPGNNFSAASSYYQAEVLADSPASYWRLGELSGSTAIDEVGTSPGTYAGGYNLGIAGALANDPNTAAEFDGLSGRISVPDAAAINFSTSITIEAWVRPDTLTGGRWIVNKGNNYRLNIVDGNTNFGIRRPDGTDLNVATNLVTTGSWQHLVGTFDGNTMVLYRNGQNVAQATFAETIQTGTAPLFIGAFNDTSSFFDGGIDEVAVYNRPLNATRVLTHYQRGALTRS